MDRYDRDKRSGEGRRRKRRRRRWVTDAKPGNLSFNLQPYIGHFKDRHILFAHDPRVSENISEFETRRRDFLVGAQPALIH